MDPEAVQAFGSLYAEGMTAVIGGALGAAGLRPQDLALYLPHNVARRLCLSTGAALGLPPDRVVTDTIAEIAHCWGADPFINYRVAQELGRLSPGDRYLMTSVGLGATFAAMVLEH
jgi:3-oxoacyl-[acyl-carrier-protein] synthase-3